MLEFTKETLGLPGLEDKQRQRHIQHGEVLLNSFVRSYNVKHSLCIYMIINLYVTRKGNDTVMMLYSKLLKGSINPHKMCVIKGFRVF